MLIKILKIIGVKLIKCIVEINEQIKYFGNSIFWLRIIIKKSNGWISTKYVEIHVNHLVFPFFSPIRN